MKEYQKIKLIHSYTIIDNPLVSKLFFNCIELYTIIQKYCCFLYKKDDSLLKREAQNKFVAMDIEYFCILTLNLEESELYNCLYLKYE